MVAFHGMKPMSATTPNMFTVVRTIGRYGRFRANTVTLPLTPSLLIEQETPQRYFVLPPGDFDRSPSRASDAAGAHSRDGPVDHLSRWNDPDAGGPCTETRAAAASHPT